MVWVKITSEVVFLKYESYVTNKSTLSSGFTEGTIQRFPRRKSGVFGPTEPCQPPPHAAFVCSLTLPGSRSRGLNTELISWDIYKLQCITFRIANVVDYHTNSKEEDFFSKSNNILNFFCISQMR